MPQREFDTAIKFKALDKISRVMEKITRKFPRMSKAVRRTGTAYDVLQRKTSKFRKTMNRVGGKFKSFGRQMTLGMTLPLLLFGTTSILASANFETAMNILAVKTGKPIERIALLEKRALALGASTQFSATQAADAMIDLAKKGFNPKQIDIMTKSVADLASAHKIELAQAADIAGGVLKAFNFPVKESTRLMDELTKGTNKSNLGIADFQENFAKTGALAAANNVEFSELIVVFGKLADGMQKIGSGRAVKNFIATLAAPKKLTKEQIGVLNKLDIKLKDLFDPKTKKFKGLVNAFQLLGKASASTGDLVTLFGRNFLGQAQVLVKVGAKSFKELSEQVKNSGGETAKNAAAVMAGAIGAMLEFKSAVETLGISIGKSGLLSWFTSVTKFLSGMIRGLSRLNPTMLKWGSILGIIAAVLGPLLFLIGGLLASIPFMVIGFQLLIIQMAQFSVASLPVTVSIILITSLILLFVAGITLLITRWDFFKNLFLTTVFAMRNVASSTFGFIKSSIQSSVDAIILGVTTAITFVENKIARLTRRSGFKAIASAVLGAVIPGGQAIQTGINLLGAGDLARDSQQNVTQTNDSRVNVNFSNVPEGTEISTSGNASGLMVSQGMAQ